MLESMKRAQSSLNTKLTSNTAKKKAFKKQCSKKTLLLFLLPTTRAKFQTYLAGGNKPRVNRTISHGCNLKSLTNSMTSMMMRKVSSLSYIISHRVSSKWKGWKMMKKRRRKSNKFICKKNNSNNSKLSYKARFLANKLFNTKKKKSLMIMRKRKKKMKNNLKLRGLFSKRRKRTFKNSKLKKVRKSKRRIGKKLFRCKLNSIDFLQRSRK